MRAPSLVIPLALLVLVLIQPSNLVAVGGYIGGEPVPGQDMPTPCDWTTFLTPSDGGSLFAFHSAAPTDSDPEADDMLWHLLNGAAIGPGASSCDWQEDGGFGNWSCFHNNFTRPPAGGQTVWGIVTVYPGADPGGTHEGWILLDSSPGTDGDSTREMTPQRLRVPTAVPGWVDFGPRRVDGVRIEFEYPTEISSVPEVGTCHLGGDTDQSGIDARAIGGFNLYRLPTTLIDPSVSRPEHYLCGPDLDCSTAGDNGWVAFIPLDPAVAGVGIDIVPSYSSDPDLWPVAVEDLPITPNPDVLYVDYPPDPSIGYAWVIQPVLRVETITVLDDWHGMKTLDLNADGLPEFVDPGGNGLGLTANGLTVPSGNGGGATPDLPIILITPEATADLGPCDPVVFDSALSVSQGSGCDMVVMDLAHRVAPGWAGTSLVDPVTWGRDYLYRVVARDGCLDPGPQETPNGGGDSDPARIAELIFDSTLTVLQAGECSLQVSWDPAIGGGARSSTTFTATR